MNKADEMRQTALNAPNVLAENEYRSIINEIEYYSRQGKIRMTLTNVYSKTIGDYDDYVINKLRQNGFDVEYTKDTFWKRVKMIVKW